MESPSEGTRYYSMDKWCETTISIYLRQNCVASAPSDVSSANRAPTTAIWRIVNFSIRRITTCLRFQFSTMLNFRVINDTQYIPGCQECNFCASWRTQMNLNVAATLWCKRYFGLDVFQIVDSLAMLYRQLQHNVTSRCYRSVKPWNGEREKRSETGPVVSNLIINKW